MKVPEIFFFSINFDIQIEVYYSLRAHNVHQHLSLKQFTTISANATHFICRGKHYSNCNIKTTETSQKEIFFKFRKLCVVL